MNARSKREHCGRRSLNWQVFVPFSERHATEMRKESTSVHNAANWRDMCNHLATVLWSLACNLFLANKQETALP
jgi:phenylalanine-4-hydroxylase